MANESYPESYQQYILFEYVTISPHQTMRWGYAETRHFMASALYFVGMFLNMLILMVFFKDGFASSTNISFFSLAVADWAICATHSIRATSKLLFPICFVCWRKFYYDLSWEIGEVEHILSAMTTMITSLLCWERLCCIAYPMKVKRIFTRQSIIGIMLGYLVILVLGAAVQILASKYASEYFRLIDVRFLIDVYGEENFGYYLSCYSHKYNIADAISYYCRLILAACPNVVMYVLLLLGTTLFIIVFKRSIQSRKSLTAGKKQNHSTKERRLMKSVLLVCIIFIITSGPLSIDRLIRFFFHTIDYMELIRRDPHGKVYFIPIDILKSINHCFNIFVYLTMNSKFRRIFCHMFCLKIFNAANEPK